MTRVGCVAARATRQRWLNLGGIPDEAYLQDTEDGEFSNVAWTGKVRSTESAFLFARIFHAAQPKAWKGSLSFQNPPRFRPKVALRPHQVNTGEPRFCWDVEPILMNHSVL